MTKDNGILILGLVVALTPFLGIPGEWKTIIFVLAGILIAFLSFLIKREREMSIDLHRKETYPAQFSDGVVAPGHPSSHDANATKEK